MVPSLSAANSKQRLLSDFDPGSVTVPSKLLIGSTVNVSTASFAAIFNIDPVPVADRGLNFTVEENPFICSDALQKIVNTTIVFDE